jgi:hypothetical protein
MSAPHKIWIAQILCPKRHCILASAFDVADHSPQEATAELIAQVERLLALHKIDPWCGICRSSDWKAEAAPTKWATMDQARPFIEELERENAAARRFYQALRGKA